MAENTSLLKQYLRVALYSIVGASIMTYFSCSSCTTDIRKFITVAFFSSLMWVVMWIGNERLAHFLDVKISWVKFPVRRLTVGVIATVLLTVSIALGLLKSWEYALDIRFGNYSEFVVISLVITFLISFFLHGREFLLQWKQAAVEAERYQKESMTATYENLKSQVNPHFLFNSLNALTNLVYEDQDKAVKFIKQLSEVYRYVLDTRDREVVPLEEELKFLKSYAYLQQIRFGDKLTITISVEGTASKVAPLALQMLLENAVKHNEVSEANPLRIQVYAADGYLVVENNLQEKMKIGEDSAGLGIENIIRRYSFLSDLPVKVEKTDTRFLVKLPII